jgi:hypothetical protein
MRVCGCGRQAACMQGVQCAFARQHACRVCSALQQAQLWACQCRLFMHGMPVAPFRARTNTSSGFAAFRVAVLSCRTDSVTSRGSLQSAVHMHAQWPKRSAAAAALIVDPLLSGVASIECNTSGLFYKGFPRVVWLQVRLGQAVRHSRPCRV